MEKIKIYRYEKPDGGGPWCTPDGKLRTNPELHIYADEYFYGCLSKEALDRYMESAFGGNTSEEKERLFEELTLKIYEGPKDKVIFPKSKREVWFIKELFVLVESD